MFSMEAVTLADKLGQSLAHTEGPAVVTWEIPDSNASHSNSLSLAMDLK